MQGNKNKNIIQLDNVILGDLNLSFNDHLPFKKQVCLNYEFSHYAYEVIIHIIHVIIIIFIIMFDKRFTQTNQFGAN